MCDLIYEILFYIGGFIIALINPSLSVIIFIAELNWDKDFSYEVGSSYLIGAVLGTLIRELICWLEKKERDKR